MENKTYKSEFLNQLQNKLNNTPFFHLVGSKEEKSYIRQNNCTYKWKYIYGGKVAIIKDKKTREVLELPLIDY